MCTTFKSDDFERDDTDLNECTFCNVCLQESTTLQSCFYFSYFCDYKSWHASYERHDFKNTRNKQMTLGVRACGQLATWGVVSKSGP